ncbi:MAG TPA: ABC transporter [Desulfotomaculum sp.]|nr:ABC transporter [Desulfotomaculum sp.]HBY05210.1 ABC transporter [Desulfotomaculum sp.]
MIKISGLCIELRSFTLRNMNLNIAGGDYFILVGPSGSGKTVLLETIAGLHRVTSGRIVIDNEDVTFLEPEKRAIGMVYQDCALFPHLSVKENIVFGLRVRREKTERINLELGRVIQLLDIEPLLFRKPNTLSGGEKQKVALARALVTDPKVLLLDEPLSALDPQSRENIRREIIGIHNSLGITVVHVTHDFGEAISMGTQIAVIGEGSIKQVGTPDEIFRRPNSEFVARFTMAMNILSGLAKKEDNRATVFIVEGTKFITDSDIEGHCYASIRPEDILMSDVILSGDIQNYFPVVINQIVNNGPVVHITVNLPPMLVCMLTRHSFEAMDLKVGKQVFLSFKSSAVNLFHCQ